MRPLVVIEGSSHVPRSLLGTIEAAGWVLHPGFRLVGAEWRVAGVVCYGGISTASDASLAVLAAARGAGLIVAISAADEVLERLVQDLSRIGSIDHWPRDASDPLGALTLDQVCLVDLLARGKTLAQAAQTLHLSRRTADRQMAEARAALGVMTTAETVIMMLRHSRLTWRDNNEPHLAV